MRLPLWFLTLLCFSTCACNQDKSRQLEAQNRELAAKLSAANLDLQDKCSKQARARCSEFEHLPGVVTCTNHYNGKLNKCFMLMSQLQFSGGAASEWVKVLSDAFEGKELGTLVNKAGEVTRCDVTGPDGATTPCHSTDEFERLIKHYMED
jgi:hypothetical protein